METDGVGLSGRDPGRARVGSAPSSEVATAVARGDLIVSGVEDLSPVISALLSSLRPSIHVHYIPPEQLLTAPNDEGKAVENAEAIIIAFAGLDPTYVECLQRVVASIRLPVLVVVEAHPSERSVMRERAIAAGAIDCLLRAELSSPLLEAAISHARSVNRQTGRLLELRQRFALAIRGSRDGMWEWDLLRDRVYYSQRWCELLGVRTSEVPPTLDGWLSRVHPQDLERLRSELDAVLDGSVSLHESEHRIRDGNDEWRWVLTRAVLHRDGSGQALRMAGSLTDISPFRQRERALREQSRHDSLTNLPDRRVFLERCARAVELGRAHSDYVFVVLLVAVDRLGQIRDSFGIDAADQLVALLAKRVRGCLRPEDHLFRFSSSKFAILLEDVEDASFGTQIAKRIHEAVAEPFEFEGVSTFITVSIGMTSSAHGYSRVEDVVTDVGAATDAARDHGSNRHQIYDTRMRIESRTLLALEMAMRRAIDDSQFELHFQPIVRVDRLAVMRGFTPNALIGFEALLRWHHPERGLVSPAEFIPIAEDTGLIVPIGRWVIREAVRSLHSWHEEFGNRELAISVNLSAKQIGDPLLLETLDAVLAETGLPGTCLKLELTESVMIGRTDEVTHLLQEIRARGVAIWIDDFGTGYSSLGYLHRFPVDGLKIDRAFVSRLDGTPESQTMVRTILDLAFNFGLEVVAEGIESDVQARHLRELGCLSCQGWLFGKPQPPAQVRALLA